MSKFTLKSIEGVDGTQIFAKLLINNECQFDDFESKIRSSNSMYLNELSSIYLYMQRVANLQDGAGHFKDITPDKEIVKEYEFKTKHLRVYTVKMKNGKLLVLGGYKNNQKKDLRSFRSIKKQLIENKII